MPVTGRDLNSGVKCGKERKETIVAIARRNHFRLQKRLNFERIPLTAEVTVCVRGGPVLRLPWFRYFFSALRDSQWGSGKKECAGEEALYR